MRFDETDLNPAVLRAVQEMGFEEMTPIQAAAIPVVLEGKDIIGQAQTGTGKTAAFGIPLLQRVDPKDKSLQALVLCPTRELAIQVAEEIRKLAKFMHGVKTLPIYGGQDINRQIRSLKGGVQVIIGTPGRVMDHMRRHTLKMDNVHIVTLDEADEMLNMGFREDIELILSELPQERQTLLFSATMPQPIMDLAATYQKDAELVRVVKKELTVPKIEQFYYEVRQKNKPEVLSRLFDMYDPKRALVFCNTKRQVDELVSELQLRGYFAEGLHGDLKQQSRDRVMEAFRGGKIDILVATDVAARGIDVDDVEAVFNYDVPQDEEYYVHRIGRTGRAGREGSSHTLVVGREIYKLRDIMKYCNTKIHVRPVPSVNDINSIRAEKQMSRVDELIAGGDLSVVTEIIEKHLEESECTAIEMAAALLKISMGDFAFAQPSEEGLDMSEGEGRESRTRLFVNVGKKDRLRPGDIVGAIAGESGMPGELIGAIKMYDSYTFVEVPEEYVDEVIRAMKNVKMKGRSIHFERANGDGDGGKRRGRRDRSESGEGEERPRRRRSSDNAEAEGEERPRRRRSSDNAEAEGEERPRRRRGGDNAETEGEDKPRKQGRKKRDNADNSYQKRMEQMEERALAAIEEAQRERGGKKRKATEDAQPKERRGRRERTNSSEGTERKKPAKKEKDSLKNILEENFDTKKRSGKRGAEDHSKKNAAEKEKKSSKKKKSNAKSHGDFSEYKWE